MSRTNGDHRPSEDFNIFECLGIGNREIHNSNSLAFILNPAEAHGQRDLFLRAILRDLRSRAPNGANIRNFDLERAHLHDAVVRRELYHIDVLIVCPTLQLVIAIENKIDAKEGEGQLTAYEKAISQHFEEKGLSAHLVYLTLTGDPPKNNAAWMVYTHADIYRVLKPISDKQGPRFRQMYLPCLIITSS